MDLQVDGLGRRRKRRQARNWALGELTMLPTGRAHFEGMEGEGISRLPVKVSIYTDSSSCLSSSWVRGLQEKHRASIRFQQEQDREGALLSLSYSTQVP